ncbi:hypothetical protein TQ38_002235 [Novosphingobium sp. P6W]|nr:hypothetical protein TQ38_002235 [Novosphingobium sp. P6W]KIS32499.1 hypothetical protein TQ38_09175 [Novosphingobium sp. P6W]
MSAGLLAAPPTLPRVQRDSSGQMTGGHTLPSFAQLYDVAGQIRATLIELQAEVRLTQGGSNAQSR